LNELELPAGLSVVKLKARLSRVSPLRRASSIRMGDGHLLSGLRLQKELQEHFQAVVMANDCASETLDVTPMAYLVNATDLSAYGAVPLAEPVVVHVRSMTLRPRCRLWYLIPRALGQLLRVPVERIGKLPVFSLVNHKGIIRRANVVRYQSGCCYCS